MTVAVDALEAIGSARAMRYLCPDPIPDEAVERLLWAATRASSAHNSQPWQFVVLRDERVRAEFGELIRAAAGARDPLPPQPATRSDRLIDAGVRNLFSTLGQAPAIILVCGANVYPPGAPDPRFLYSAMYSAAQNLLVAARPRARAGCRVHHAAHARAARDPAAAGHPRRDHDRGDDAGRPAGPTVPAHRPQAGRGGRAP
jgi:nitroreductase